MKTILTVENIEKYYGNRSNITKAVDNIISFSSDSYSLLRYSCSPMVMQIRCMLRPSSCSISRSRSTNR